MNSLCLFPVASSNIATLLPGLVDWLWVALPLTVIFYMLHCFPDLVAGLWVALPLNSLHFATLFPDLLDGL